MYEKIEIGARQENIGKDGAVIPVPSSASLTKKMKVWLYLGPFLLLLSLSASLLFPVKYPLVQVLFTCLGLFFCNCWNMKGFWVTFLGLCVLGYLQVQGFSGHDRIWCLGLLVSLAISFLVTALCSAEVHLLVSPIYKAFQETEGALQKMREESVQKESKIKFTLEDVQKKLHKADKDISMYKEFIQNLEKQYRNLEQISRSQSEEITSLQDKSLQTAGESYPPSEWEDRYKQLRKQFQEKSDVLDQTRKDLFEKDHNFLVLHRERMLSAMQEDTEMTKMMQIVSLLHEEKELLEQQLLSVEGILGKFLSN
jgi:hypothetical protein